MDKIDEFISAYRKHFGVKVDRNIVEKFIFRHPKNYMRLAGLDEMRLRSCANFAAEIGVTAATVVKLSKGMRHEFFEVKKGAFIRNAAGGIDKNKQAEIAVAVATCKKMTVTKQPAREYPTMFSGSDWDVWMAVAAWQRENYPHLF